jgi:nucleoside phosphorylase
MNECYIVALKDEVNGKNELNSKPIFYSGVGKLNAALCMMDVINKGYDSIINIGSCGSKNHKVGELLKVGKVYQDIDVRPISDYGITSSESERYILLDDSSSISCFTTDYFFDHNDIERYSNEYLNMIDTTSIIDMECYSLAKVANYFNINFKSYKWVSDDGDFNQWINNCRLGLEKYLDLIKL